MDVNSTVLIYRDQLLPYSETFIPAQVENYASHVGYYVGTTHLPNSLSIPRDRTLVLDNLTSQAGVWKTVYKLTGTVNPVWRKQAQALSPKLIHAHFGLDGVLAMPLARALNLPLVVTFHGYYATTDLEVPSPLRAMGKLWQERGQFFRELYFRRRTQLFQQAKQFVAVSEFIRTRLVETGCPPEKIEVHYIGIDTKKFVPETKRPCQPIVLFVGRLVEKKGCEYLIQAMTQVQQAMPEAELTIVGDGPLRKDLETQAKQQLRHYCFLGVQPSEVVRDWMNRASVLCAPSITTATGESEGLPIVILEAQAMELPVVSSIHAGIPEAVQHGETGLLTAEKDWQAIAQSILQLLQQKELRQRFAIAGRRRMEQRFNLKRNTAKLEDLYRRIYSEPINR